MSFQLYNQLWVPSQAFRFFFNRAQTPPKPQALISQTQFSSTVTMVKFASLLSVALLPLALLSASPLEERNNCIADGEAKELLHKWISFFVKLDSKLAKETLTPGFAEYSASTNFFLGKDVSLDQPWLHVHLRSGD